MTKSIWTVSFMAVTLLMVVTLPYSPTSYADVPCPFQMTELGENLPIDTNKTLKDDEAILGDAFVTNGATLTMNAGSCVGKNVFLEDGAKLIMKGNTFGAIVEGSVFVKSDGSGPAESVTMNDNSHIKGDLLVEGKGAIINVTIDGIAKTVSIEGDILIKESAGNLNLKKFSVSGDVNVEGVEDVTIVGISGGLDDVRGDISINGAGGSISITKTGVTGDVRIKEAGGSISITETDVGGDVSVEGKKIAVAGSLKVNLNEVTGDIQLKNNLMTLIEVNDNTLTGGGILMEGGVASSGNIEVMRNGVSGGNPSEIQMKGNDAKIDLLVKTNQIGENLLMENNIAGGDLKVDMNQFFDGLLIAKENTATNNISISGNGPLSGGVLEILQMENSTIGGDIDVNNNTVSAFGKFEIKENTAGMNLNCSGNMPLAPVGSGNTVIPPGTLNDQCSGLG